MSLSIKLEGIKGLQASIDSLVKKSQADTHKALAIFAKAVEKQAKRDAPANEGTLRNSINGDVQDMTATIVVRANYGAYLEFGTRKFAAKEVATLPPDWAAYAATFKGPGGGTMDQFIQDIMQWVQQKGIGAFQTKSGNASTSAGSLASMQSAAYAIALNILQNGIRAQPYLRPAVEANTPKLIENIKKAFEP